MIGKRYTEYIIIILLSFISFEIIFNNLGASTFFDWDESHYGEVALEMLKSDNWIVLTYGGQPDLIAKPPLGAWLIAVSFKIFGVTEFALRFWSALFGVATIILVYFFGKEIENECTGIYSALFLLTSVSFIGFHGARTGDFDVILTFFITLSLYFFYLSHKRGNRRFLIGTAVAIALAVLVKGPIGLFPVLIIGIYLVYFSSLKKDLFNKETIYAFLSLCILVLPLFAYRYLKGKEYFQSVFEYDVVKRIVEPVEGHVGDSLFYFNTLFYSYGELVFILIILIFFYSVLLLVKKNKQASLLVIWISVIFIFFTIAKTKIFWYIMPIYPALSLLIGYDVEVLRKTLNIRKKIFMLIFLFFMINPFITIVQLTESIYNEPIQITIKELKGELKGLDVIYIHLEENRQSIYLYLNSYVKDKVIIYNGEINEIDAKKGDGIITFNSNRYRFLSNSTEYELIKSKKFAAVFRKV